MPIIVFSVADAVAGTEKSHVDQDYRWRLHESVMDCQQDFARSLELVYNTNNKQSVGTLW